MAAASIVHLLNFDMSLKGREFFSRDNTHGKLLATDHGTFGTTDFTIKYTAFTRWVFDGIWNRTRALRSEAGRYNHDAPHGVIYTVLHIYSDYSIQLFVRCLQIYMDFSVIIL